MRTISNEKGRKKRSICEWFGFFLSKDGAVEWGLAERAFAARGGVLYELFALLLPQDVIGIKPRVDTRGGAGLKGFILFRTNGGHEFWANYLCYSLLKKGLLIRNYSAGSPINRSFGALSILRDKKEAMDIAARLSFIPQEILNIENNRLELEQILGVISAPVFLASVDPGDIHNHILHLRNAIHILENSKRALLEEQQELIVAAAAQP